MGSSPAVVLEVKLSAEEEDSFRTLRERRVRRNWDILGVKETSGLFLHHLDDLNPTHFRAITLEK